ncbi:hypothetical protein G9A89_019398 [Geosiphon pyriformis]|nr:hypothetical protein G9A89_019398 [Geosiphon pyriformis]
MDEQIIAKKKLVFGNVKITMIFLHRHNVAMRPQCFFPVLILFVQLKFDARSSLEMFSRRHKLNFPRLMNTARIMENEQTQVTRTNT